MALQRVVWSKRVDSWDHHGAVVVQPVIDEILARCPANQGHRVLDLGCGTGTLAIPLARRGSLVTAVDVSPRMIERLEQEAKAQGVADSVATSASPAEKLSFPPDSFHAVVSNYALHHLRDVDKVRLVQQIATWLEPGGTLVIGDMMFGRGATAEDRRIIRAKVTALVHKGPGGWWRVVKNAVRFSLRIQERPLPAHRWMELLRDSGFVELSATPVVAEAAVVSARWPDLKVEPTASRP